MILETSQLLSSAHHVLLETDVEGLYKLTHKNHPCAVWVRESSTNYKWTLELLKSLHEEYTYRYGKKHKSSRLLPLLTTLPKSIRTFPMTAIALAMPDEFKVSCPVASYRNYYRFGKQHLHKWKDREVPWWINSFWTLWEPKYVYPISCTNASAIVLLFRTSSRSCGQVWKQGHWIWLCDSSSEDRQLHLEGGTQRMNKIFAYLFFICTLLQGLLLVVLVADLAAFETSAIKHGAAYYDPQTAKFTWKDNTQCHSSVQTTKWL